MIISKNLFRCLNIVFLQTIFASIGKLENGEKFVGDKEIYILATVFESPFMILKSSESINISQSEISPGTILDPSMVEGYCVDLAQAIFKDKLKLQYKFKIEKAYGRETEPGLWNGLIGSLIKHTADVALAPLTITPKRTKIIDFSHPFMESGISLIIYKEKHQKTKIFSLINFVSIQSWIFIIISWILIRIVLCVINNILSNQCSTNKVNNLQSKKEWCIQNICLFWIPKFTKSKRAGSISEKCIELTWYLFVFILFSWYLVHLNSLKTSDKYEKPIKTIDELNQQSRIRFGLVKDSSTMRYFNQSKRKLIQNLWKKMLKNKEELFLSSINQGLDKVRQSKGNFVLFTDSMTHQHLKNRLSCDLISFHQNIASAFYAIGTVQQSKLTNQINSALIQLKDEGFIEELKLKWYNDENQCFNIDENKKNHSVYIENEQMICLFTILLVGLIIGLTIGAIEFLIRNKFKIEQSNQH